MVDIQAVQLIELITHDMREAMKNKERNKLDELRSLLARIHNAEAITPPTSTEPNAGIGTGSTEADRKQLTLADIRSIIHAEMQEIETALVGIAITTDYSIELHEKLAVVQKYVH